MNQTAAMPPLTALLAARARQLGADDTPDWARELARQCILDWFAVTIAGATEPLVDILVAEAEEQGGRTEAGLVGRRGGFNVGQAALINGAASHALDYDDVNLAVLGHPTVAVFPGLLALAAREGKSGRDTVTAFIAGYETACRIGLAMAPGHYGAGFHATSTVGCFGAAAACARLLELDQERTEYALGLAGTQAAGLKSMFGTMAKPFHAGNAANNGLRAALLARRGFTARPDVLECAQGFAATQTTTFNPAAALRAVRRRHVERLLRLDLSPSDDASDRPLERLRAGGQLADDERAGVAAGRGPRLCGVREHPGRGGGTVDRTVGIRTGRLDAVVSRDGGAQPADGVHCLAAAARHAS